MVANSKYPTAYWSEWGKQIVDALGLKQTTKGEFHGSCPNCGGKDRFWINEHQSKVSVHCRQCGDFAAIQDALKRDRLWPEEDVRPDFGYEGKVTPFKPVQERVDMPQEGQPYHIRKGVKLLNAALDDGDVVYKIWDVEGKWVGSQFISPDGRKKFTTGMKKDGAFGVVGGKLNGLTYVVEGWADACSVHEATGRPVVIGLDAGNVPKVVAALQEKFPSLELVLAADNDKKGLEAAEKAGIPFVAPQQDGWDFNDLHQAFGVEAVLERLEQASMPDKPKPLWSRIGDLSLKQPEWVIDGILEKHALVCGFGAPAAGKTFVMVDMALSVASQKDYHGREVDGGTVFYIAGEGHNGFVRRCRAWAKFNDVDLTKLPFFKSNRSVVMNDAETVAQMFQTISDLSQEYGRPKLVVIDTLARSMGGDENSTKDMNEFIKQVDRIKDTYGCTVLVAHHTGHGSKERGRGSSAWLGALDAEFSVTPMGDLYTNIKFTKMKDAAEPEPITFAKHTVELLTEDMKETSSIALEKMDNIGFAKDDPDEVIKIEYEKLADQLGDRQVPNSLLKKNASIELGCSAKTVERRIKDMIEAGIFSHDGRHVKRA